jgi:hypothetical protein
MTDLLAYLPVQLFGISKGQAELPDCVECELHQDPDRLILISIDICVYHAVKVFSARGVRGEAGGIVLVILTWGRPTSRSFCQVRNFLRGWRARS